MDTFQKIKHTPEIFFVATATIFGMIFALLIPPFQTPDEYIHFYRAYETSELRMPQYDEKHKGAGSQLPRSIKETESVVKAGPGEIRFNPREKYDQRLTKHALLETPLDKNDRIFYDTVASTQQYLPISYLPQALTIFLLRLLDSPIVLMIYFVRIVNLILWVSICALVIKIFPWKKWSLVLILLIPIVVSQSVSLGLDVVVYGSALLFIALAFRSISNQTHIISKREYLVLLIAGLMMVFGKVTFAVLLPLILLLKPSQFNLYPRLAQAAIIIVPSAFYFMWSFITKNINPAAYNPSVSEQIQSIISNPFIFPFELLSTFFFVWGDSITQSLIGNFGWLDTPLSAPFVGLGFVMLATAFFVSYGKDSYITLTKRQKLGIATMALAYFVGVSLAMYIYSTQNDLRFITGIQGRYLIPILALLIPVFYTSSLVIPKRLFVRFVKWSTITLLIVSTVTIFFRYYIVYYPMS